MTTRLFPTLAAALALAVPVAAHAQVTPNTPEVVTSPNVEYIGAFKLAGEGRAPRIIGDTLYATSSLGLFIFDISDPENPRQLGGSHVAKTAPAFYQRIDCGIFKSLKLSSSVFGGIGNRSLGIAYKLEEEARPVSIVARVGSKVVKRFTGKGTKGRTFRFSLPASAARRGQTVRVSVQADRGEATPTIVLTAKRI